jgi:hypothetical protein
MNDCPAKYLEPFRAGTLQDLRTALANAVRAGVTSPAALLAEIDAELATRRPTIAQTRTGVRCRACGGAAKALPVNNCRGTMVGGRWRSVIQCDDPRCGHSEYSTAPAGNASRSAGRGRK